MPNINRCMFAGHLGKNPETKTFAGGGSVCNFTMAVTEKWKGKDGQPGEHTEWLNCVAHGKTGELVQKYLTKGSAALIEGRMRTRSWEKDGKKNYMTEIHVDQVHFLGKNEGARKPEPEPMGAATGGTAQSFDDESIPFAPMSAKGA